MKNYRHGDVSFHGISKKEYEEMLKKSVKTEQKGLSQAVIELGEATGHRHVLTMERPETLSIVNLPNREALLKIDAPAKISHEEHEELSIAPGFYVKKIENEFDPFSEQARRALD